VNEVVLSGEPRDLRPLRYTPAGIPVAEFSLHHASTQPEAGGTRKVELDLPAVAIGPIAEAMRDAGTERRITARGFLAARSRGSTQVVLHALSIDFA